MSEYDIDFDYFPNYTLSQAESLLRDVSSIIVRELEQSKVTNDFQLFHLKLMEFFDRYVKILISIDIKQKV